MYILLTNDDGVFSRGLRSLHEALKGVAKVTVVAPEREMSTVSHAITLNRTLKVRYLGDEVYSVDGTPADCVNLAIKRLLGRRPDLVISGINQGENMGQDVLYSGTVSAAFEGTFLGVPSVAVSLAARDNFMFETACQVVLRLLEVLKRNRMPEDTLLNVNVPNIPMDDIKGFKVTRQGKRIYGDKVILEREEDGVRFYRIDGGNPDFLEEPGTDFEAVREGFVSITPLHLDFTNHRVLSELKNWSFQEVDYESNPYSNQGRCW